MKDLFVLTSTSQASSGESSNSNGATQKLLEVFKNPVFYIVVGALLVLIIAIYLLRRFVGANPGQIVVVVRRGKIRKIISENDKRYYRVPFLDSVGAVITLDNNEFVSDRLFVNDGPDHLYKFNYTFDYRVTNSESFYENMDDIQSKIEKQINDSIRLFADNGNASIVINEYRSCEKKLLDVINKSIGEFGIEAVSFKVNYIEPIGR